MKLRSAISIILLAMLTYCGIPKAEYEKVVSENKKLQTDLDECINGADRIIAQIEKSYNTQDYKATKLNIALLSEKHPESPRNIEFKELLKKIAIIETELAQKREATIKDSIRLANLNNTGIWGIGNYVDEFGEPTKDGYITNLNYIKGYFSNTATQNSDLNVQFLISNSSNVSIQLYEYASNNPVKAYSAESYYVSIQDKDSKRYSFTATNYSDRLRFNESDSRQVHRILMKGGLIKFRIQEVETSTTNYQFEIEDASYYDNAYRLLLEKSKK